MISEMELETKEMSEPDVAADWATGGEISNVSKDEWNKDVYNIIDLRLDDAENIVEKQDDDLELITDDSENEQKERGYIDTMVINDEASGFKAESKGTEQGEPLNSNEQCEPQQQEKASDGSVSYSSGKERRVYVGNLSYQVTWKELKDYLRKCGNVLYADVLTDYNGMSKGCGVVEFSTKEEAERAIAEFNNTQLLGRSIFIRGDREKGSKFGLSRLRYSNKFAPYHTPGICPYYHDGGRPYSYRYSNVHNNSWDMNPPPGTCSGTYKYRRFDDGNRHHLPPVVGNRSRYDYYGYKDRSIKPQTPRGFYPRYAGGYDHESSRYHNTGTGVVPAASAPRHSSSSYYNNYRSYPHTTRPNNTSHLYSSHAPEPNTYHYYRNYHSSYPPPSSTGGNELARHNTTSNSYSNIDASSSHMQYYNR